MYVHTLYTHVHTDIRTHTHVHTDITVTRNLDCVTMLSREKLKPANHIDHIDYRLQEYPVEEEPSVKVSALAAILFFFVLV